MWLVLGEPLRDESPEATWLGRQRGRANAGAAMRAAGFSWIGELSKISDRDSDEEVVGFVEKLPLPNRNGGN